MELFEFDAECSEISLSLADLDSNTRDRLIHDIAYLRVVGHCSSQQMAIKLKTSVSLVLEVLRHPDCKVCIKHMAQDASDREQARKANLDAAEKVAKESRIKEEKSKKLADLQSALGWNKKVDASHRISGEAS